MVSSTGPIFIGFAVPISVLCAKASRDMIAISDRQSHSLDSFLLILRTVLRLTRILSHSPPFWPPKSGRQAAGTHGIACDDK